MEWRDELLRAKERFTTWPLDRLVSEGFTVPDLCAEHCGNFFGRPCVRFASEIGAPLPDGEFRRGDFLIVSEGDPLRSRVKAQVLVASRDAITCVMRAPPHGPGPWRLDRAPCEVAHARSVKAIEAFGGGAHACRGQVRRLLLELDDSDHAEAAQDSNAAPELRLLAALPAGAPEGDSDSSSLDPAQQAALRSVERRRVALIQGPPGCGKTRTACALLQRAARLRGRPLLACADSNVAVDQLLRGLLDLGVRAVRLGSPLGVTDDSLLGSTVDSMLWAGSRREEWRHLQEEIEDLRSRVGLLEDGMHALGAGPRDPRQARAGAGAEAEGPRAPAAEGGRGGPAAVAAAAQRPGGPKLLAEPDEAAGPSGLEPVAWRAVQALRMEHGPPAPHKLPQEEEEEEEEEEEGEEGEEEEDAEEETWPREGLRDGLLAELASAERQLSERLRQCEVLERVLVDEVLDGAEVVCATLTGCGSIALQGKSFDMVLVDEASQATEPRALIAVGRLAPEGRLVLVGDQRQLPPVCTCRRAQAKGLGLSLFDRLLRRSGLAPALLAVQYRMHPLIRSWPSRAFYGGLLRDGVPPGARAPPPGLPWPAAGGVAFVEAPGPEESSPDGLSRLNRGECEAVCRLAARLARLAPPGQLGVISPYRGQVRLLRRHLPAEVEVATVDGFQGREKPVVVISCVRANPEGAVGFLADPRRLNVALTRARCGLVVVGNRLTLQHDRHWRSWFGFVDEHGLEVDAARFCQGDDSGPPSPPTTARARSEGELRRGRHLQSALLA